MLSRERRWPEGSPWRWRMSVVAMEKQGSHHFQSDYYGETTVHPLALAALLVALVLTFTLPRKWALLPGLCLVCFVPSSQRVVLLTLDFTFVRLIAFAGLA